MEAKEYYDKTRLVETQNWTLGMAIGFADDYANYTKLSYQLFIGKVAEIIGEEKTTELLRESKEAINNININKDYKNGRKSNKED